MGKKAMGQRLQAFRKQVGMTQSKLAEAAGVPLPTLQNWERGHRKPSLDNAVKLARALGVSLDELAGEGGGDEPPAPRRRKGR
jgi:transcriptional regulator with XRE-family HTH domain